MSLPDPPETTEFDASGVPPPEDVRPTVRAPDDAAPLAVPGLAPLHSSFDYELLAELAAGGMGVVYKARQVSLNRVVAVKMIRSGQFADLRSRQRFLAEAEAAASLDHPNVVPIYEIGEMNGEPFLSMKLVEGGSLASAVPRLADRPRDAAALMVPIARAVHHAHQRGILHRDLKPANVLLDTDGRPHVTDFGLAKRLDEDKGLTQTGVMVGTPSYMAPEQTLGTPLTVAADVYGLGAILYECLTVRPPFTADTLFDTVLQVRNDDPVPPSRGRSGVARDLETICLKALAKEPAKRYATAAEFADDLERFLNNEPVVARPLGRAERLFHWVQRKPHQAALAAVVTLATLALLGVGIWSDLAVRASDARSRQALEQAHEAIGQLHVDELQDRLADEPGRDGAMTAFLESTLELYDRLPTHPGAEARARRQSGQVLRQKGNVLRLLDRAAESEGAYDRAIELLRDLYDKDPQDLATARELGEAYTGLGELFREKERDLDQAHAAHDRARAVREALAGRSDRDDDRRDHARSLYNLGIVRMDTGRTVEARRDYEQAVKLLRSLFDRGTDPDKVPFYLAQCLNNLALLEDMQGAPTAEGRFREAIDRTRGLIRDVGPRPEYRRDLAVFLNNLGYWQTKAGRRAEAVAALEEAEALLTRLHEDFPKRPKYQRELAQVHNSRGFCDDDPKNPQRSLARWETALSLTDALVRDHSDSANYRGLRGMAGGNLGFGQARQGDLVAARTLLVTAVDDLEWALEKNPRHPQHRAALRQHAQTLAETTVRLKDVDAAARAARLLARNGDGTDPEALYVAAAFLARCVPLADAPDRLADEALSLLHRAVDYGFRDGDRLRRAADGEFAAVAARPAFVRLLTDLKKSARPVGGR